MSNIAVVGAGPMGLAATYELLKQGHTVTLFEADSIIGGMTASFDFDGLKIERFYHFICRADRPLFELLEELEIGDTLRWQDTSMGYYHQKRIKPWGDPLSLLTFPGLSLISKIRYGLLAFSSTKRSDWKKLDNIDAITWLKRWVGEEAYNTLWKPLFELKFYHYTNNLSAAWIWSRLKRVGTSRKNIFQEQLGYLDGGSDTFLYAIKEKIEALGGNIKLSSKVEEILINSNQVTGLKTGGLSLEFDQVISTIPLPYVNDLLPSISESLKSQYSSVKNIAVVCVLAKLKKPITPHFWLNVSDDQMDIPGMVEYSNLRPLDQHVAYFPFYMPGEHELYQEPNEKFTEKIRHYIKTINPSFTDDDIICIQAGRYRYAQPICEPGFLNKLPEINPGIGGLFVADTSYYYPEDRSISESVKLGKRLATMAHRNDR